MSKSNTWETDLLTLLFNNTAASSIGDGVGLRGSSTAGSLYISLHTSDPGEAGDQTTNETGYGAYTRIAVARSSGGWIISGNQVTNAATVTFPQCTSGSSTLSHFGIGTDSSGAGKLLYSGALNSNLSVSANIQPKFDAGLIIVNED